MTQREIEETPGTRRRVWWQVAAFLAATYSVGAYYLALRAPQFEPIFRDFGIELPGSTKALLQLSRWWTNDYGWLYVALLFVALAAGTLLLPPSRPSRRPVGVWLLTLNLTLFCCLAIYFTANEALMAPLLRLMQSINGASQ